MRHSYAATPLPEWGVFFEDAARQIVAEVARARRLVRQLGDIDTADHLMQAQIHAELIWVYGERLFQEAANITITGARTDEDDADNETLESGSWLA